MSKNLHQSEQLHFIIASLVILKCSENLCCISAAFDDFLSFCLLCSFQGTTLRELCSLKTRQCRKRSTSANRASPFGSRSWDVFAYELFPNPLRPSGLLLRQLCNLRKEVIQPHLPIRLPCYDFTPVIAPALDGCLLAVGPPALGVNDFRGVTGGVYKARERIHRSMLTCDY